MENLAHIAYWTHPNNTVGSAILAPRNELFEGWLRGGSALHFNMSEMHLLALFSSAAFGTAIAGITEYFPRHICSFCVRLGPHPPCWYWRECHSLWPAGIGQQTVSALRKPSSASEEEIARRSMASNALSQLTTSSANLRDVLNQQPTPRQLRQRVLPRVYEFGTDTPPRLAVPESVQQAPTPTPVGTVRCTACHQVIPRGFDKTKDAKKTEDEIYAECQHEFALATRICIKCEMPERKTPNRFSLLEVD